MTNTINKHYTCVCALFASALAAVSTAQAQTCATAPSCSELGYTKSASDCTGKTILYCPFDKTKAYCSDDTITPCSSLGFTDTVSSCPGEYVTCPSDATKGKCINGPQVGDIKYSLNSANHNGWLLCNGGIYEQTAYSKLYKILGTKYCSIISAGSCASGKFAVPDYRGYFLRGYGAPNLSSTYSSYYGSYNYSISAPQKEQLPNLKGGFGLQGKSTMDGTLFSEGTSYSEGQKNGDKTTRSAMFNASKYNSIYGGSHVIPSNYGVYIFIYAGPIDPVSTTSCASQGYTETSSLGCLVGQTKVTCPSDSTYYKCTGTAATPTIDSCSSGFLASDTEACSNCTYGITPNGTTSTNGNTCYRCGTEAECGGTSITKCIMCANVDLVE